MNWITTNIRFPEDLYMELKMAAARKRTSVASVIRERVNTPQMKYTNDMKRNTIGDEFQALRKRITRKTKGMNFSEGIIRMRYEQ